MLLPTTSHNRNVAAFRLVLLAVRFGIQPFLRLMKWISTQSLMSKLTWSLFALIAVLKRLRLAVAPSGRRCRFHHLLNVSLLCLLHKTNSRSAQLEVDKKPDSRTIRTTLSTEPFIKRREECWSRSRTRQSELWRIVCKKRPSSTLPETGSVNFPPSQMRFVRSSVAGFVPIVTANSDFFPVGARHAATCLEAQVQGDSGRFRAGFASAWR